LEIYPYFFYCSVLENTDPSRASPFVGISASMITASWTMPFVCGLPMSIHEPRWDREIRITRRVAGAGYRFSGLRVSDLNGLDIDWHNPFWVMITAEAKAASLVEQWRKKQRFPPLHISNQSSLPGVVAPQDVRLKTLRQHCIQTLEKIKATLPDHEVAVGKCLKIIDQWVEMPAKNLNETRLVHNCTDINNVVLESAGYVFGSIQAFTAEKDSEYVDAILKSIAPIDKERAELPLLDLFKELPPVPETFVFAPAMYRSWYEQESAGRKAEEILGKGGKELIKGLQKQTGYRFATSIDIRKDLVDSPALKALLETRSAELNTQSAAVAVRASSHFASTIRVPLGVNRSLGRLRQLAYNARGLNSAKRRKFAELFRTAQREMETSIDPRLRTRIEEAAFGIKLISDAPLEWLPSGDIPLSMRHNVTRIPATPGNLSIGSLTTYPGIGLKPSAFDEILHIDAAPEGDAAHGVIKGAIDNFFPLRKAKINIRHVEVKTTGDFVKAMNSYDGPMVIFDGHGSHSDFSDIGNLYLGNEKCDVWALKGIVRTPPIVLLSACDTHALDRSHATVANGFLALGSQSVIATLLPIGITSAAVFVARFLYRLAEFIPAAIKQYERSLRWPEVVSGMLRMQLATDVLRGFSATARITEAQYEELSLRANLLINGLAKDWYERLLQAIVATSGLDSNKIELLARHQVAMSDAIRYVHLGNGEHITIGDFHRELERG